MNITIERYKYTARTTIGKMYINGEYFCYTLEDTVRAEGIKVYGETAIPSGTYEVKLSVSSRFKRLMPSVTSIGKSNVEENGISFSGIRIHGGNSHENTHGCPLVAKNKLSDDKIQGTMEKPLTAKIKEAIDCGETVLLVVKNLPQQK